MVASMFMDLSRVFAYSKVFYIISFIQGESGVAGLIVVAIIAAYAGSFTGRQLLKKVTLRTVQHIDGRWDFDRNRYGNGDLIKTINPLPVNLIKIRCPDWSLDSLPKYSRRELLPGAC